MFLDIRVCNGHRFPYLAVTTIDRYIFCEWLKAFTLALGVTLGLLLLEDMYDDLPDLLDYGAGPLEVARYYVVLIPSLLPTILPLALIISILFSLGNLHRNNEIMAMRAGGLNLWCITRSLWLAGGALSLLLFYLNAHLVPRSVELSRTIRENYSFASELQTHRADQVGIIKNLAFYNNKERRLWFMNRFSEYTFRGYGLTVSTFDSQRREIRRIAAEEGYYDDLDGHWVFLRGRETIFDAEENEPIFSLPFEQKSLEDFTEEPSLMKFLEKRPKDLSFFELRRILDKITPEENPRLNAYAVRYHSILANPVVCLIVIGLAVPFAVAGVRVNPIVGVSKSYGLFFAYYLAASMCTLLGERAVIGPMVAAWTPQVLMLAVALYLFRKAV